MSALGPLTSPQVAVRSASTLVVPLGATEQHGPHLPLDTDTRIAETIAARVVARVEGALLGPTIAMGASGEHTGFAGTLSIGTEVLAATLVELRRSAGPEFARVVVINAHGGNVEAIASAEKVCALEGRELGSWTIALPGADAHAGRTETSLMLAIAPDVVRLDRAEAGDTRPVAELLARLRRDGLRSVTSNGVLGDPAGATAEEGREVLERLVTDAVEVAESAAC